MGSLKPWQLILVILGVVVLGVSLWMSFGESKVPRPKSIYVADVETGDLFKIDTSGRKIALLPATNPKTGLKTLYPVRKNDDGDWIITPMGVGALADYEGPAEAIPDWDSRLVSVTNARPKSLN